MTAAEGTKDLSGRKDIMQFILFHSIKTPIIIPGMIR